MRVGGGNEEGWEGRGLKRYCSVKEADEGEGASGRTRGCEQVGEGMRRTRGYCEEVGEGMRRTWRCED